MASRALGLATASQLGFNASILLNPYVLAAAAIIALGTALYFANENMSELTETQQMQLEATGEVAKSMAKEHSEFTKLWDAMTKVNPKSKEGLELKKQLNTQFPQYLKNIDLEKAKLEDLPNLYSKASEAAFMYHAAKNLSSKMEKTLDEKSEIYLDNIRIQKQLKINKGKTNIFDSKVAKLAGLDADFGLQSGLMAEQRANDYKMKQKNQELIDLQEAIKELSSSIKQQPTVIETKTYLDGREIAKSVNNTNTTNNRGSFEP